MSLCVFIGCVCCEVVLCVFFFKQKTAYEMRISDWSSDVCSSDLATYNPVFGADGTPRKVVKIATDITRQVRQEREARHRLADSHRLQHDLERHKNELVKTMNQLADIVDRKSTRLHSSQ